MKNLIRKILKEEGGFKDSTEEDWEWTKMVPEKLPLHRDINDTELFVDDWVRVIDGEWEGETYQIERLLGPDDGWDEGHPELSYGHCGTEENGGCITTYDRGGLHFVGKEFELVRRD
jgi:hypothetical protein